ncbi:MAG: DEAD/DEAH box helicase [Pseudomonadota bacterium]
MRIKPRDYQKATHDEILNPWKDGKKDGNPVAELATGLGKSIVVAMLCRSIMETWPSMRIMMLVHNRELVRQNYEELKELWPEAPVGLYCAGLNSRDTHHPIIFASIQSIYNKVEQFGPRHITIADECHRIPIGGDGIYQKYLKAMALETGGRMRVIGLTATPYRMDSGGLVSQKEGAVFERLAYKYGVGEGTRDGWLCPLTSKLGAAEIDVSNVKRRGGEFVQGELTAAAMKRELVEKTCDDIVARARADNRRSWLLFCSGVPHAAAVEEAMQARGITARSITGETPKGERDYLIEQFKMGAIQCLTNAEVLTTGFNAPGVDLIALLRPTLSTSLYVQMLGRGTRVLKTVDINGAGDAEERKALIAASAKPNCLILDYAGNVRRFGPVDMVGVHAAEGGSGEAREEVGAANGKECPDCGEMCWTGATDCPSCGHEFEIEAKHEATPDDDIAVLSSEVKAEDLPVHSWRAQYVAGKQGLGMMRVEYRAGVGVYNEFWCFNHRGKAKHEAFTNWQRHTGGASKVPGDVDEALCRFGELVMPRTIRPVRSGKFHKITNKVFSAEDFDAKVNIDGINGEQWEVPRGRWPGQARNF